MRFKNILLTHIILLLFAAKAFTQVTDTIPYKVLYYDVKKQQTVNELAASLKVAPNIIVKLNRLRNIQQTVVKGQRLKVPVYQKVAAKKETKPAEKTEAKEKPKATEEKKEPAIKKEEPTVQKEKEPKKEPAVKTKKEAKPKLEEVRIEDTPKAKEEKKDPSIKKEEPTAKKEKEPKKGSAPITKKETKPKAEEAQVEESPKPAAQKKEEKPKKEKPAPTAKKEKPTKPVVDEVKIEEVAAPAEKKKEPKKEREEVSKTKAAEKDKKEKDTTPQGKQNINTGKIEPVSKGADQSTKSKGADTAATRAIIKQQEKEKEAALAASRRKLKEDSIKLVQQRALKAKSVEITKSNYDPEIDQTNLMLLDATLELNEAMLAGVKASLDTLNKPDPPIKNQNDVREILARMKRNRERIEMKPYLEYMNDSLALDCNKLRLQKEDILSRLNPYYEHQRLDSLLAAEPVADATPVVSAQSKPNKKAGKNKAPATTPVEKDATISPVAVVAEEPKKEEQLPVVAVKTAKAEHKPKEKPAIKDTIIVQDAPKPSFPDTVIVEDVKAKHTAKDKKQKQAEVKDNTTTAKNETQPAKTAQEPVKEKKEEVAVIRNTPATTKVDTASKTAVAEVKKTTPPVTQSTASTAPAKKNYGSARADTNVVKEVVIVNTDTAHTALVKAKTQPVATKTTDKKPVADNTNNADTIKRIKSELFLKRAQKALAEKNEKAAEENLLKSIELYNNNYDAWMTLADLDMQRNSPVKALKEYQECARIDSSKPKLFYKIASLYVLSKKKTEAMQYFNETVALDAAFIPAYMDRASIYSDWKQYDLALADYNTVIKINKSFHNAYRSRGMVLQLTQHFSDAVDDFTRYLIFEETDASAYYYRGLAKIGNRELQEGCIDLSKSAEMGYEAAAKALKKSCE